MSKKWSSFTPGPWRASGPHIQAGNATLATHATQAFEDGGPFSAEQQNANARLMAAGPELYEALETILETIIEYGEDVATTDIAYVARAALEKVSRG